MNSKKKVFLISLGCAKNLVDSENILGIIDENGFPIVSSLKEADIAVLNTCGFIQAAVEECIDTIFELCDLKERGELERIYVVGCFVQRYGYKLRREIPEVDGWLGTGEIYRIGHMLQHDSYQSARFFISRPTFLADHTTPRIRTTPFYSTYLKISEGCSHGCAFCSIPALRGDLRSREMESLIIEAEKMLESGVKEINLLAQDTTMYGRDLNNNSSLEGLLERLVRLKGEKWIRLLYMHPSGISDRLLELIESEDAICPYMDLPLQHVNKAILEGMGRYPDHETPMELIERIRARKRRLTIRTTLMVGFPGETDEMFKDLYDFVRMVEFDYLGTFIYSPEKGTSAERLNDLPEITIARERRDAIMGLQREISEKRNRQLLNKTIPVLVEGASPETDLLLTGRTSGMAPEVDGQVLINKGRGEIGNITNVKITEAYVYDLVGEIVEENQQTHEEPD